ncbi:metal-dependent hydrolase [Geobacillus sp. TFV-3]|uniref:metal-dependent hydrolase n=1 Tax=Geobacillus sp. TFV-3 TaxID=1897059 RepID=UPI001358B87D|nr:metal-dependent hydrolase [Geobacillus sp. TFV-3]KAF0995185.1 Inner membrane protein YdjM [Geobacillus sp. TFV-3]
MRYSSHVIATLCLGAAASAHTGLPFTASYTTGLVIGSLLPDIDEPSSYVGRRSFGVARKVKEAFGHRGMTHSLIVWGVLAALVWRDSASPFATGLVLGCLFHIVEDFFSVQGVPLLWPFSSKRWKVPLYRTGKGMETVLVYAALAGLIYLGVNGLFCEWWRSLPFGW